MKRYKVALKGVAAILLTFLAVRFAHAAEPVSFAAPDGGRVYGDVYRAGAPAKAAILLFHQAGSNRGEYSSIAPRLAGLGYNVLAIDQRAGGNLWGRRNETVDRRGGESASYAEVLPDLEGGLAFAENTWPGTRVIVWGSSYSASLVFFLAARHPNSIIGVLSFSPGEYFPGVSVVEQVAKVSSPVFITSAPTPDEIAAAKHLADAVPGRARTLFVPEHGVHGAATLREDSNGAGADQIWQAVEHFLAGLPDAPRASTATP
ncbi:MAG: alpha/beta hydrolase [Inquilinus limosus]|uniref:Alpha/beta hydrolase n=1 Tax=Inquilinus limosus TaxID=171674 RepID=A0A952KJY1_9PROT|nr:alpha/beta hydrolase [Inquilinus limosus]